MYPVLLIVVAVLIAAIVALLVTSTKQKRPQWTNARQRKPGASILNAAAKGNVEAVREGISQGADPNEIGPEHKRPLHWAAQRGHKTIAAMFIDAGAKVNAKDKDGCTPLHLTCGLSPSHESPDPQLEIAKHLIEHGAGVNPTNNKGITPLSWAVRNDRRELVELLLSRNAAVTTRDSEEYTALFWARTGGDHVIVEMLEQAGAKE
jgi:ankyrin repeat protein